jgi:hypothetical protein
MQYVPLVKSAAGDKQSYAVYYYLALSGVTVGGKAVRLPARAFAANAAGPAAPSWTPATPAR